MTQKLLVAKIALAVSLCLGSFIVGKRIGSAPSPCQKASHKMAAAESFCASLAERTAQGTCDEVEEESREACYGIVHMKAKMQCALIVDMDSLGAAQAAACD